MSGGSYNYLHTDMEMMADRIAEMREDIENHIRNDSDIDVYAASMAAAKLAHTENKLRGTTDVAHAFEWFTSGDYGHELFEEEVKDAI